MKDLAKKLWQYVGIIIARVFTAKFLLGSYIDMLG